MPLPPEGPITPNQCVGRTVVPEPRLTGALQLRANPTGQHFPKLNAPLVEGVDAPDAALCKHAMLVERDELAERFGRQAFLQDRTGWSVAVEDAVRRQPVGSAFRLHFLSGLTKGQGLGLGEDVGHQKIMMLAERIQALAHANEIAGDERCSLCACRYVLSTPQPLRAWRNQPYGRARRGPLARHPRHPPGSLALAAPAGPRVERRDPR